MPAPEDRRKFLKQGTLAAGGMIAAGASTGAPLRGQEPGDSGERQTPEKQALSDDLQQYSRYRPSYGGPVGGDQYLGKLVPGLRESGLAPVPLEAPDLGKLSWKMVDGRKEFHLHCTPVEREFLPGNIMNVYGFNGSMPGPTIEATQGDRVRIVVHNQLPEPTSVHWHGLELPISEDGVPGLTQDPIPPGKTYVYEFDLHQTGSFFYHSHMPMQEAFGMVGWFIIHPAVAFDPVVDRDFGLIFQNFQVRPANTVSDSWAMDWSWHTINGRSGPYTTPLVCRLGERVRIRLLDFSPMQHHPIHLHGHTFWLTGTEGGRIPNEAWIPRNNTLTGVAMVQEFEFVAFNAGDWIFHCHMVHHMMNHMVRQVGPRIREESSIGDFKTSLTSRPRVDLERTEKGFETPGYPQKMMHKHMVPAEMKKIDGRKQVRGMRHNWHMGVKGLMTVVRVLPDDLYDLVMNSEEPLKPGQVFDEIVRRVKKTGTGRQDETS